MTNLLQRLGLVTGLGLAAVALEGCERTVEVRSSVFGGNTPAEACDSIFYDGTFRTVEEHIQKTSVFDIPISSDQVRTVERIYWCGPIEHRKSNNIGNYMLKKGHVKNSRGEIQTFGPNESLNPTTGEIIDNRYQGGSSL